MSERLGASFSIDVTDLKTGLTQANRLIRESESQFKSAAAGLDDWRKSEDGLNAKIKSLNDITDLQKKKVDALKTEYKNLVKNGLDPASKEAIQLRTKINNEEAALRSNEKELKNQKEALKEVKKGTEEAGQGFSKFGEMAKAAGAVAATAIAAAGAAVGSLLKSAIEGYAETEQLVGGVETLFGAGGKSLEEYAESVGKTTDKASREFIALQTAQRKVIENANNAYKTAGMTANDYMSNVTAFSAALISSLEGDTLRAAEVADRAMTDMSDNANKMGTDIDSIVQTYQSLARGNYQMLDNLKLGYGGTKTELERLIEDASKLEAVQDELNVTVKEGDLSFANIVNAISVVQKEMGITGTTAKEASTTIQGSLSSMQAAWGNLVAGLADENANIDQLITNFIDSVGTMAENLLPRVTIAIDGILKMVQSLIPQLPPMIAEFLPVIIDGIMGLLDGIVAVLPTVINTILEVVPQLLTALIGMLPTIQKTIVDIIIQVINALTEMLPTILDAIMQIVPMLITSLVKSIPKLITAAIQFLMAIVEAIPTIVVALIEELPAIVKTIVDVLITSIPQIINGAITLLMAILDALPVIIQALNDNLPEIIITITNALVEAIPMIVDGAIQLFMAILDALPVIIDALIQNMPEIIATIVQGLVNSVDAVLQGAIQLFSAIIKAIPDVIKKLGEKLPEIITAIVNGLKDGFKRIKDVGKQMIEGLWEGIKEMGDWIGDKISGFCDGVIGGIKSFFGIASPSKLMENLIGKNLALGIGVGFEDEMNEVNKRINNAIRIDDIGINARISGAQNAVNENSGGGKSVIVYQTNNYSQAHSRYEIYQSKKQTMAAVQLALAGV